MHDHFVGKAPLSELSCLRKKRCSHDLFTQNNFKLETLLPESFNRTERFTELDPPESGAC